MTLRFLHLFPEQLGLNGETGNLDCLVQRLRWSGVESEIEVFDGSGTVSEQVDAVFVGSGTLAGATSALGDLMPHSRRLLSLADNGVPFLALGLGWEILGQSIALIDGTTLSGIGVFPSTSARSIDRASSECFGFDDAGNLTTGFANHSATLELLGGALPLITLRVGYGNSSAVDARQRPDEGLMHLNLMAARMNGPLLPLNPHLADRFIALVAKRSGFRYQLGPEATLPDGFAQKAREELKQRLAS
jgi:CobQ-like glutamine amidotransferase family enzyme